MAGGEGKDLIDDAIGRGDEEGKTEETGRSSQWPRAVGRSRDWSHDIVSTSPA